MKIVYVTDVFAVWGGVEKVLADKMNVLAGQYGWEVTLLTTNQGDHPLTYELYPNVRHVDLGVRLHLEYQYRGFRRLLKRQELNQILKDRMMSSIEVIKPDVIVCVKLDFIRALVNLKGNIPLVVESHTLCHSEKMDEVGLFRRLYIWSLKRSIRKADAVIALTEGDANDWKAYNGNIHVIPNVINLNESGSYASCEQKSIIYVGRFSRQKDIDSLFRIWEIIYKLHPDWQLDIYGEGELKEHYLSGILKMNANIHVYKPTANIMEIYRNHSILLLTSLYEPFGLVLPEAMSCGLPVVTFDCPYGPASIVTDGEDGFLIKDRDLETFAEKVCSLIENEELRKEMGQKGLSSSRRFGSDRIMPQWLSFFESMSLKK